MPRHIAEYLTLPGRILVVVTLLLAFGGPWLAVLWLEDSLPPGSYPVVFFMLPMLIVAALFFALTTLVLRLLGVPVFRQPDETDSA